MEILLTGMLSFISAGFCNRLCSRHKVVLASDDIDKKNIGKKAIPFVVQQNDEKLAKIFHSYNFSTVLFFSPSAAGIRENRGELSRLETILRFCAEHEVKNVIYISSASLYSRESNFDENAKPEPCDSVGVELEACERLCEFYRKNEGLSILILRVPYLYGYGENASAVANMIKQAIERSAVRFAGSRDQICEFLSEEDFSDLILRIIDDWPTENVLNVPGGCSYSFSGLGVEFIKLMPTLKISYSGRSDTVPVPVNTDLVRREYDWIPVVNIADELPRLIREYSNRFHPEKSGLKHRFGKFIAKNRLIVILAEIIFGYLITEMLNSMSHTMVQFQYIDFRLLYVVLISTMHGIAPGMAAAALVCVSLIIGFSQLNIDWEMLLYNPENWVPFACYLIVASIAGYTKERYSNKLKYLKTENSALDERYKFLYELYREALKNKGEYKAQILSYSGSFGRIYEVARRLNSLLPEVIFKESLASLEDLLMNQTICIYTISTDANYARLAVCSQKLNQKVPKSLKLDDYAEIIETLRDGEVWCNKDQNPDYPDYCAGIFRKDKPVVLIMIQKVKFEQMAMYYQNLIRILCGLIQVALIRAYEYNEKWESERYLPGTNIIDKAHFRLLLDAKNEMAEKEIAEFTLIRILCRPEERASVSEILLNTLRSTDYIGIGEDDELYALLSQAGRRNIDIIAHRLREAGIEFEVTDQLPAGAETAAV